VNANPKTALILQYLESDFLTGSGTTRIRPPGSTTTCTATTSTTASPSASTTATTTSGRSTIRGGLLRSLRRSHPFFGCIRSGRSRYRSAGTSNWWLSLLTTSSCRSKCSSLESGESGLTGSSLGSFGGSCNPSHQFRLRYSDRHLGGGGSGNHRGRTGGSSSCCCRCRGGGRCRWGSQRRVWVPSNRFDFRTFPSIILLLWLLGLLGLLGLLLRLLGLLGLLGLLRQLSRFW